MNTIPQSTPERYVFGPYEIIETLGRGGMGVVYRANDRTLKREVALKILRDDLRGEQRVLARFRREAETFARLDHPNIVHIHSVGVIEQIPFIAMEYIAGETLASRLRREGPLPWQEALRIGQQVAEALQCAHMAQVVHRDVKPGNILLSTDGGVHVTDFGIAKVLNAETQLTIDGSRLGTPQYMCPERCKNKSVTPVSDLYSLGVVLFQAITGKLPYSARSSVELIECIVSQQPLRASSLVPGLPEPVDRLLAWLLEKKPTQRPVSAGMLAEAIGRVLAGKPLDSEAEDRALALADLRRPAAAPKPAAKTVKLEKRRRGLGLTRRWKALPAGRRAAFLAALVLIIAGSAAAPLVQRMMAPGPLVERLSAEEARLRWNPAPALISFAQERPGVRIATLGTARFDHLRLLPGAATGRFVVALGARDKFAAMAFDAENGESQSLLHPMQGDGAVAGVAPFAADALGESLLVALAGETRLAGAARGLGDNALYASAARASTLPYLTPRGWETAVALSRGGRHEWRLESFGPHASAADAPITAPGAPIVAAAATAEGERFAFLREGAANRELWVQPRGGEAVLVDEGALQLSSRAWDAAGQRIAYAREGDTPEVVVTGYAGAGERSAFPGRAPQFMPWGGLLVCIAPDALQREQLFAVDPARPLAPTQLTHVEMGVGQDFAMDLQGRWVAVPLKENTTAAAPQLLVLDLQELLKPILKGN
jgi:tRNA A-37 threonylcarbamoyl transferase component Bud32